MSRILSRKILSRLSTVQQSWLTLKESRRFVQSNPNKKDKSEEFLARPVKEKVDLRNLRDYEKKVIFKVKDPVTPIPAVSEVIKGDESMQSADYFQVHNLFTVKDLFSARVHLGHKIGSLHSNMRPFIFGNRFDSLIFDLDLTAFHLRQALNFTAHIAYRKGIILFISRSPQNLHLIEKTAIDCGEYAHTRAWEETVFTDSVKKFGGITRLPDIVIFFNMLDTVLAQHRAVSDAAKLLIPTVAIVDSNCDPNLISYPVPGNDDTPSATELYCKLFKEAILRGKNKRKLVESQSQSRQTLEKKVTDTQTQES